MITIGNEWDDYISGEFEKEYYITLREKLCVKIYAIQQGKSPAFRAGSLSRGGAGPWTCIFRSERRCKTTVSFKYFSGTKHRLRRCAPKPRMPNGLDNAGCDAAEHGFNGERGRGKLTQKFGLDNLYR